MNRFVERILKQIKDHFTVISRKMENPEGKHRAGAKLHKDQPGIIATTRNHAVIICNRERENDLGSECFNNIIIRMHRSLFTVSRSSGMMQIDVRSVKAKQLAQPLLAFRSDGKIG